MKAPAMQFYVKDWQADTDSLSLELKGAWIQILCKLHLAPKRGQLTKPLSSWARILGVSEDGADRILRTLERDGILTVRFYKVEVRVMSRRMERERKAKEQNALYQQRHRQKEKSKEKVRTPSATASATALNTTTKGTDLDTPIEIASLEQRDDFVEGRQLPQDALIVNLWALIDLWHEKRGSPLIYPTPEDIEKKLLRRGIPPADIEDLTIEDLRQSVKAWQQHLAESRKTNPTGRTWPWGLGYLRRIINDKQTRCAEQDKKQAIEDAKKDKLACDIAAQKDVNRDQKAMDKAWKALSVPEKRAIFADMKNKHGEANEFMTKRWWWKEQTNVSNSRRETNPGNTS